METAGRGVGRPLRKAVHAGTLIGLPLLRALPAEAAAAAALLFALLLLPLGPVLLRRMVRPGESRFRFTLAIAAFPLGVGILLLLFPDHPAAAAGAWAVLAAGDAAAWAGGRFLPGPVIPWNRGKSVAGMASFIAAALPAGALAAAWAGGVPLPRAFLLLAGPVLAGAIVESLPIRGGDNLPVILVAGSLFGVLLRYVPPDAGDLPARAGMAAAALLFLSAVGRRARAFDRSGALAGSALALPPWIFLGWRGFAPVLLFTVLGSAAGRLRRSGSATRSARHAAANLGPASFFALLAGLSGSSSLAAAFLAAVTASLADTLESEIGLLSPGPPRLITSGGRVAAGTNGAVSPLGTAAGAAGAILLAACGWAAGLVGFSGAVIAAAAGFAGSLADSLLGATAERAGRLTNGEVNALSSLFAALLALAAAAAGGPPEL